MKHNRTNNTWFRMSRVIVEYWLGIFGTSASAQAAIATTHLFLFACFLIAFPIMLVYALLLAAYKYNEPRGLSDANVRSIEERIRRVS